ncbi:ArnT family glycosyltransferase [Cognatishimia maritima]|uniref:4-amino-4-deoxy-L-arabinose transferase n=1 Tax=Cognatishimia maritima TaxID=870908 RepID=A0A1M5T902_9RHOB|nr:glycosyltransferase family 39 protein [Cognatishimia maritima]SHH47247.1 4-amino-4-deoxy-L-arabinose transferase [Cognatishimia maritima]
MKLHDKPQFWLLMFAAYFAVHVAIRVSTGGALGLDEAQIYRHAQFLDWGYGPQPPLYAWLQFAVFQVTGDTLFGLSLLKNMLLFTTVTVWFFLFRSVLGVATAGLLACSFMLIPQFSWESQRALTHSVMAGTITALYFSWFWQILSERRVGFFAYVVLGLLIGAGVLSKATFLIVPVGTFVAAISIRRFRSSLSLKGVGISLITSVLVVGPHLAWIAANADAAFGSAWKFARGVDASAADIALQGVSSLTVAVLSFALLALLVLGILWIFHRAPRQAVSDPLMTWLTVTVIASIVTLLLVVILSQTTNVKDRWLQAALMPVGPLLVWLWLARVGPRASRALCMVYAGLAVVVMVGQPYHSLAGKAYRAAPYGVLTPKLTTALPVGYKLIVGDWAGGNLLYQNGALALTNPTRPLLVDQNYAVAWTGKRESVNALETLSRYREQGFVVGSTLSFSAPYRFDDSEFSIHLALLSGS